MEQLVARWAHNPKVTGSSPVPATRNPLYVKYLGFSFFGGQFGGHFFSTCRIFLSRPKEF